MKKKIYIAVAVIAALSSCSSEEFSEISNNSRSNETVFTGVINNDGVTSRTTIATGTTGKKVCWNTDTSNKDVISINGINYTATANESDNTKATFATESTENPVAPYNAYYPASMYNGGTISLPSSYTYTEGKFNMPMYAYSASSKDLSFQNVCGVLAVKVTSAEIPNVTSISVTSDRAICGECSITADASGNYSATATETPAASNETVTLYCGDGVTLDETGTTFYIPLPVIDEESALTIKLEGGIFAGTKTTAFCNVKINRNTIYNVTASQMQVASFSVSDTKKVNITRSNVYYDGSDLHFEAYPSSHQITWNTGHVSIFFCNGTLESAAAATYTQTGTGNYFSSNVTIGTTSGLRTLTHSESEYLFNTRTMKYGKQRYILSSVASSIPSGASSIYSSMNGMFIFPDDYSGTYSEVDMNAIDAAGIVFLPTVGYRNNSSTILNINSDGNYGLSDFNEDKYYYMNWSSSGGFRPAFSNSPNIGTCVRLVKDVE